MLRYQRRQTAARDFDGVGGTDVAVFRSSRGCSVSAGSSVRTGTQGDDPLSRGGSRSTGDASRVPVTVP